MDVTEPVARNLARVVRTVCELVRAAEGGDTAAVHDGSRNLVLSSQWLAGSLSSHDLADPDESMPLDREKTIDGPRLTGLLAASDVPSAPPAAADSVRRATLEALGLDLMLAAHGLGLDRPITDRVLEWIRRMADATEDGQQ